MTGSLTKRGKYWYVRVDMGKDPKTGKTIGESEKTCVVYGMPRVASELGGLDYVVDLEEIPNQIIKLLK